MDASPDPDADLDVLLTNDDGIDAPGLRALAEELAALGEVRVLAPATNQSAVGRGLSYGRMGPSGRVDGGVDLQAGSFAVDIDHADHELGYAVHGTPCDCVILGLGALEPTPDVVVAGCNPGANLGAHVLPRSGTASAAEEAACLGVPAMALSMDTLGHGDLAVGDFERACRLGRQVLERALAADAFETADYLNVNVPRPDRELTGLAVTRPTDVYEMDATLEDGRFRLRNPLWEGMATGDIPDPEGTDRRALLSGAASVSPLSVPSTADEGTLAALADVFGDVSLADL
jgi:5'-nucleotidase